MTQTCTLPEPLAGKHVGTFAHKVLTHNLPTILDRVIEAMQSHLTEIPQRLGIAPADLPAARKEIEHLEGEIAALKTELLENRPLRPVDADLHDTVRWNESLERERRRFGDDPKQVTWLGVRWLYAECYLYRRMREIFATSRFFKNFRPFYSFKEEAFFASAAFAANLATRLLMVPELVADSKVPLRDLFYFYVMTSLWGNQCDLSLSCGQQYTDLHCDLCALQSKVLVNQFEPLWRYVRSLSDSGRSHYRIDVVLDNASYELFTDLCLVQFLHQSGLLPVHRTRVHFHVKAIPWFVSDTMRKDFAWLLNVIQQRPDFPDQLKAVDREFATNVANRTWVIEEEEFWTLPYDYSEMAEHGPELYRTLATSDLVIFKGDLNYRKLVGDLSWPVTATFKQALRHFQPHTAICSLRTVKADVVVGVEDPKALTLIESFPDKRWMETGEFAVIHFLNNREPAVCEGLNGS